MLARLARTSINEHAPQAKKGANHGDASRKETRSAAPFGRNRVLTMLLPQRPTGKPRSVCDPRPSASGHTKLDRSNPNIQRRRCIGCWQLDLQCRNIKLPRECFEL